MRSALLSLAFLLSPALHAAIIFDIEVNTSSINGTSGYMDMQFNPGGVVDAGTLTVSLFSGGTPGAALAGYPIGNVTGLLPSTVTFVNDQQLNYLSQSMAFNTNLIKFRVTISGDIVDNPNPANLSGSSFGLSFFGADSITPLLTTDTVFGEALRIDINPGAVVDITNNSPNGEIVIIPEPATITLLAAGLGLLAFAGRRIGIKR